MVVLNLSNTISADKVSYIIRRKPFDRRKNRMEKHMRVPFTRQEAATLKSGDYVYLTGTIYTARDAAHKRMYEALMKKEALPFDIRGNILYGAVARKRRAAYWFRRPHHRKPYG